MKKYVACFYFLWNCPSFKKFSKKDGSMRWYFKSSRRYKKLSKGNNLVPITLYFPCLTDRFASGGTAKGHYFWQDLFVAKKIYTNNPQKHVDIGSSIAGFVSHVCIYREIEVFDIRPLNSNIPNVKFVQADLMVSNQIKQNYCDSLSCLHAMEHFGLGRYGDQIDVNGHIKGMENIYSILKTGGKFYFSVPIGKQRTEFNAHRVFSVCYLLSLFNEKYTIDSFSYVDDNGDFYENRQLTEENVKSNFGCKFGCGIFELTKI